MKYADKHKLIPGNREDFLSGRGGGLEISRDGGRLRRRIGQCWGSRSALWRRRRRWRGIVCRGLCQVPSGI